MLPQSEQGASGELGQGTTGLVRPIVNGCSPAPVGIIDGDDVGFDEAVAALRDPVGEADARVAVA